MAVLTPYWVLDALAVLATLLVGVYFYTARNFRYWKKRGVEQLTPSPIFGNFGDIFFHRKSCGEFVKEVYENYKGLRYVGFYFFDQPHLMILDPDLVKQVLIRDFNYFPDRFASPDLHDRIGASNLFMIKNPAWKSVRQKLTPIYTSGKVKKMFELMRDVGNNLDKYLESLHLEGTGQDLEMKELSAKFMTDMIASTAFGLQVNSLANPDAEFRKFGRKVFDFSGWRGYEFMTIFFYPVLVKLLQAKFFGKETTQFFRSVFWETINHRMQSGEKRNDLIDTLVELNKKKKENAIEGFEFDGDDLLSQAAVFFTGGFETTSLTTSFTLYEIALNSEIQTKLRQEIHDALEETNGEITYEMVSKLPYMDMVIAETLRKYPPLPFLDRVVAADYKIPGSDLVLKKGMAVYIPMMGFHYDAEFFPDPDRYDPERFSEENKKKRTTFTYFPFGEGPHICIGMRIGVLQVKLALAQVLRKWEFLPCATTPIPLKLDSRAVTMQACGGLNLTVRKLSTVAG